MKRRITERGAPKTRKGAEKAWTKCWKNLSQARIQEWIKRILRHIAEIIRLKDENKYREGRVGVDVRAYDSNKRANKYIRSYMKQSPYNTRSTHPLVSWADAGCRIYFLAQRRRNSLLSLFIEMNLP